MKDQLHQHHILGKAEHDGDNAQNRPYWKSAHRDWRIWAVVFVMLVAMYMYVVTEDFSVRPQSQPPPAGAVGK